MTKTVRVVAGLIVRPDGTCLMARRRHDDVRPDMWEFPGGKMEHAELPAEALRRELKEELGVEVIVGARVSVCQLEFERKAQLSLYHCILQPGSPEPQPLESSALRWIRPASAIQGLPCTPTTYIWYPDIRDFLNGKLKR